MGKQANSIFGLDMPDEATVQQRLMAQALAPITQAQNPYERIGAALGTFGGAALTGAFGAPDPTLQTTSKIKTIQAKVVQSGEKDPTKLATMFADELAKDPDLSSLALQVRASIPKTGGKISLSVADLERIDPAQRAQVIANYQATGQLPSDISLVGKPEDVKKDITFYKANPEQATFRLQEIVTLLEADPNNKTLLKEYEQITAAASEGARENYNKEQKRVLDERLDNVRLATYRRNLEESNSLSPAARWNAEIDAARDLLKGYNINPNQPLQSQKIPASILYGPAGSSLVQASQLALRKKTTEGGKAPAANKPAEQSANTAQPDPVLLNALQAAKIPYEPNKYDYRVVNGKVQRAKKGN
jgi:hypothetical protein